jgi:hypothetical protein
MGQFGGFTVRTSGADNVQGGSFSEMGLCIREVRFDRKSRHGQPGLSGPKGAKTRLMHCNKRRTWVSFDHLVGAQQK